MAIHEYDDFIRGPLERWLGEVGNLPHWTAEVPNVLGTYGLVIGPGGDAFMPVVAPHVPLPDGYVLLPA